MIALIALVGVAHAGCRELHETPTPGSDTLIRSMTADLSGEWSFRLASTGSAHVVRAEIRFPRR